MDSALAVTVTSRLLASDGTSGGFRIRRWYSGRRAAPGEQRVTNVTALRRFRNGGGLLRGVLSTPRCSLIRGSVTGSFRTRDCDSGSSIP